MTKLFNLPMLPYLSSLIENDFPSRSDLSDNNPVSYGLIVYGIYHTRDHQTLHSFPHQLNSPGYTDFRNHGEMFWKIIN